MYYNLIGDIMKKIIITIIVILLITGCSNKEDKEIKKEAKERMPQKEVYKDLNTTPIGIYSLENNTLKKQTSITKHLNSLEDIDIFNIFPSNESTINLNSSFGESFYNEWNKYSNIKQGINIKYYLNDTEISYNILSPKEAFDHWEYLMNYLYDDYINRGKSFYSHMENDDFNSNSLITSIKLQSGYKCEEIKKIELTAFTYDSDDDLINNTYRGNSKDTLIININ